MVETPVANGDGNSSPSHYDDTRGGFRRIGTYDSCDSQDEGESCGRVDNANEGLGDSLSLNELMYSAHSFHVMSFPVSITMILAALAVTYVNTPQLIQQGAELMSSTYHVWKVDTENDSTSRQLALDLANGLVIVTVIGTMTFGIVLLYKYRCMKILIGYMMFSSMTLLGVLGAELFNVAIEKYRVPIDWFSFVFGLVNFAVVGVIAIFYQQGIPPYITQAYLIMSSVIIAWQLSHFDTISTWTLLVMLGLYDLCAVLTPCGPLRFLVNLMSDEDSPDMPGLLYEAEIPEGLKRPVMGGRNTEGNNNSNDEGDDGSDPPSSMTADGYEQPSVGDEPDHGDTSEASADYSNNSGDVEMKSVFNNGASNNVNGDSGTTSHEESSTAPEQIDQANGTPPTAKIPFGIAKLYRLPLTSPPNFGVRTSSGRRKRSPTDNISTSPLLKTSTSAESENAGEVPQLDRIEPYKIPEGEYTPAQMRTVVEAQLPRNGAKIAKQPRRALQADKEDRYAIIGRDGTVKRILFVDKSNGKVYEELDDDDASDYEGRFSNTIKLGLGDFIFYSVLVAKSAQYSFPCFVSSFLVILAGLGGTLVLLAVFKHALPALPISIFLAVGFYVIVRFITEPWIHAVMSTPIYV